MTTPKHIVLFFLSLSCCMVFAQRNPQPYFRNYSTADGLPSSEVYVAFEDRKGYMWFGTDNGACRFDGYTFRSYGAGNGLMSNVVFDIYEDNKGRIWFGTMTGEAFILEGDTILPYPYNDLVQQYSGRFTNAGLVYLTGEETAYFDLERLGILSIDKFGKDSLFTSERPLSNLILAAGDAPKILPCKILREGREQWPAYYERKKVIQIEYLSDTDNFQIELPAVFAGDAFFTAQQLSSGHLLIYRKNILYCLQKGKVLWTIPFDFVPNEVIEDEEKGLWLCGQSGKGLRRYRNLDALKNGTYDLFLNGLSISNFYKDSKGGVWIPTQQRGVFYCSDWELTTFDSRFGFSDDFVSAVAFKNDNTLFAGCENGVIFEVDLLQNRIKNTILNRTGLQIFDLIFQPDNEALWCNGAFWKNGRWNFVRERSTSTKEWLKFEPKKLEKLQFNARGELLGCNHFGLYLIDVKNDSILYHSVKNGIVRCFAVHSDASRRIWVGNSRGVFEFKEGEFVRPDIDHPAFYSRTEDIDEMPDGRLVLGTKGWGVILWKDQNILQISGAGELTSDMIEDVHVDEKGVLWAATLNGLNKITFDESRQPVIRQFTVNNGLPSNEIYKVRTYKGRVWLCTAGGLVRFHERTENPVSPPPVFENPSVNGEETAADREPIFSYWENNFAFHYLAINYRQNGKIPYRYRLSSEDDWTYTQNLTANYPQLPWGKYAFEVQARNEDGYWSESAVYPFLIKPPWWATSWFLALTTLAFLSSGIGFYKYRIHQLQRENRIQKQITELERSALQAQMNPHFIFNSLNSIQNFILQNDRKQAVEYLARFAKLVRTNLQASVQGMISLEEELSLLDNYLALERQRFEHSFDYVITVAESLEGQDIGFPPMLIQPYVENAVVHGMAKKEGHGTIRITFDSNGDILVVSVKDNGFGYRLNEDHEKNIRHKSMGMTITQKRLELLGADLDKTVKITTLKNEKEEIEGTEVCIFIKIQNEVI